MEAIVISGGGIVCGPSGTGLFGGHSLRVAGAQRLASLGVEVVKIMVLARWSGSTVFRYTKEAPLDSLPKDVKALGETKRHCRFGFPVAMVTIPLHYVSSDYVQY